MNYINPGGELSDGRGSNAPHTSTDSFTITGYEPAIKSITDYYPYGMQMPDRCYSDGTTHTTNISAVTTVPVHRMVNRVWPDLMAVPIGGAIILTGSSPLGLVASGLEALSYELPRYIGGLLHTVRIFTHGTVPPGFRAEISMGGTSSSTTSFSGISTDLTYTPISISVPYLHIYNLGMRDTIFIDSVHIDSATYEPYHVLSSISSSDGYAFNGKFKDNEYAGLGNYVDYGDRGLDTRTGRWQTPDKLQAKYPGISPYAYCANSPIVFLDPDGNDVHVYLSAKPVGTTKIRLIQPSGDNGGAPKTVEVPLYQMTVTSDASKKASTYFVTRDGPMLNSADPVDKAWMPWNEGEYNVVNTAFDPTKDNAMFNLVPLAYPKGMEAYALRNPDGTPELSAEPNESPFRQKKGEAKGVMIHVGGVYIDADGNTRITGSEGCLTLSGKDKGNAGMKRFVNDVNQRKKEDKAAGKGNDVDLKIQKRTGVESNWKVDKDGKKQ